MNYKVIVESEGPGVVKYSRELDSADQIDAVVQAVLFVQMVRGHGILTSRAVLHQLGPEGKTAELDLASYLKHLRK